MARKLKGKIGSKGLKGALLRHQAKVKLVRNIESKQEHELRKKNSSANNKTVKRNQELQKLNQGKVIPFEKDETLMLCGEGDFSFARSIVEQNYIESDNLIITSYDNSVNELKLKYPHTFEENYQYLKDINIPIFFQIDVTKLVKSFKISKNNSWFKIINRLSDHRWGNKPLQNIVFNFPHNGKGIKDQERNIREHQNLIFNFFQNSLQLFNLINTKIQNDSLRYTQGYDLNEDTPQAKKLTAKGYGNIILSLFDGEPYDSWQIKLLAKKNGLTLSRSSKFQWEKFPEYHHRRTNSEQDTTKPAKERDARFYIFSKYVSNSSKHNRKSKKDTYSDSD
ncbi:CEI_1a_G0026160.mRNA.1.CDS.1 [Saccharomyces cerevisiae]|nr:EM14S01-3B_G0052330.mRNA.1.CDS.1 [Saccharomyces cerevisiae]CAI4385103.1 AMH_1a_G0026230.mRNA.1.CDS.1 [Saccharomyces cerevisiae]CAI4395762.1 CEI_1a_G0026160.mRNA.1.CDS.1 [Saccharomyces cerevisiae]CAI6599958.1 AMH_1a_G0026230.mRNA.1.CDS.1 [Saccharomyces cerevisiae]CAI7237874.1 CEI_1a_G0026160.mRNA.1.CDS.1 [Saccharomyces cerevisiae]